MRIKIILSLVDILNDSAAVTFSQPSAPTAADLRKATQCVQTDDGHFSAIMLPIQK